MATSSSSLRAGIVGGVALLLTALVFPHPGFAQRVITVAGQVRTPDGQPMTQGAMATLATQRGSQVGTMPTDSQGQFQFEGLSGGTYELTVTADNFQTYHQTLYLAFPAEDYFKVDVILAPLANRRVPAAGLPSLTDEAAPKTARREFSDGVDALKKKDRKKARLHLEKAVEEYPCYARAQATLAQIDIGDHKLDRAEAGLKKAIQCDGTFLDSYYLLAEVYITEKKLADSETVLQQGLRVSPSAWPFHYQLGRTHFAMGKYQEASKDFATAEQSHPDMPADFHAQLANAYLATGQEGKALAEIDTYLKLDPHGRFAETARRTSQTLRSQGVTAATAQTGSPPPAKP
jgi:tetratricopeptide (TPR) repeat protein